MSYDLQAANAVFSRAGGATANLTGVAATAAKTYTTQNMTYSNQGKLGYIAGAAGATTPTTDAVTGKAFKPLLIGQGCCYVWVISAGAVGLVQGPVPPSLPSGSIGTNVDSNGNFTAPPQFPGLPDSMTPFAYSVVTIGSTYAGTGFIPGSSDNWNATGVTTTQQDVGLGLPQIPQTS
ncbi:MAG: hypothetical protein JO171_18385 [Paludibacterium sp.]|uniref:hypothetical protein n=1 Tax=Paludibacterium sp. TaxID=1917523 RepID=UPI0025F40FF1|nr:hypothetical protein [Paludibacterium sp.]MBV8049122.1 hypothetical protein [Paludibacterium sp.]